MPIETIEFNGQAYPAFQASGNAARFVREFAQEVCKGNGVDIGCNRDKWSFPGAFPVDPLLNQYNALNLPDKIYWHKESYVKEETGFDYIHSSHCLEHLEHPYTALNYWHSRLKTGGVVFLYLPDFSQHYWRPWLKQNSEHVHSFTPEIIRAYFTDQPELWKNVFVSGVDLNNSFIVIAEKV